MPSLPEKIAAALNRVRDHASFLQVLLAETLGWPIADNVERIQDISYGWTAEDLRAQGLEEYGVVDGLAWQMQPFHTDQEWGIFVLEFSEGKVYRTALRQVLRGLVPKRSRDPALKAWHHENLLFLCTTPQYDQFTFAHFRGPKAQAKLTTFGWQAGDRHLRTVCEFNLRALAFPDDGGSDAAGWLKAWGRAFDKEPLTKDFFRRFDKVLAAVQRDLQKHQGYTAAEAYSRAQLLLERLAFLYFLQNRGWLDQKRDFLPAAFQTYRHRPSEFSFYEEFLEILFWTLSSAPGQGARMPGIPFLNGGLFDDDEFAPTPVRKKQSPPLKIRNDTFALVFDELLEAFNFTVREDTPLDQDVAVDPEMLGKVFESIVLHAEAADPDAVAPDKRKATGSYYTPRIVVHFICREALRLYLEKHLPGEDWGPRLKGLLEIDATAGLRLDDMQRLRKRLTPAQGAVMRDVLKGLKCCDPAVGSGAFPVGLLHELLNLRRLAEAAANGFVDPVRKHGNAWLHDAKEDIVQNCLFGVDIQQQAIEICRLRLWLSLVVDYDLGLDPFTAERSQFIDALGRISQLPNLEMNFHRGDSLLDLISDVPVRIEPGAMGRRRKEIEAIQKLGDKLHRASRAEKKKELRVEILNRRLTLTEQVLADELHALKGKDASIPATWLLGEDVSDRDKRRRLAHEMEQIDKALAKIQTSRKELEKLAARTFDSSFYPKLRKLEGADFDSPFNFAWRLDFAPIFARDNPGFDIVVGNPPFVTARNPKKRELYRERWKRVCSGKYLLVCPFFELSFGLLRAQGQLGLIVSNAFTKREFGKPLVQNFLRTIDLEKIFDCSGLLFPGHGTPTCITFAKNQDVDSKKPVRLVMTIPGGGDLRTPPEESPLWETIAVHHDFQTFEGHAALGAKGFALLHEDSWIAVGDCDQKRVVRHPCVWSFFDWPVFDYINSQKHCRLADVVDGEVGVCTMTNCDEVFPLLPDQARRLQIPKELLRPFQEGEDIRNWAIVSNWLVLTPYDKGSVVLKENELGAALRFLSLYKKPLEQRKSFGNKTFKQLGRPWFSFERMNANKYATPFFLAFGEIATHGHFVHWDEDRVYKQTTQTVKLPKSATTVDYHLLGSVLNSSLALFWLKQTCFNKGAGNDEERDRYVYAGRKVDKLPLSQLISARIAGQADGDIPKRLVELARSCWELGKRIPRLAATKLLEKPDEGYHNWNSSLSGYMAPEFVIGKPYANTQQLHSCPVDILSF